MERLLASRVLGRRPASGWPASASAWISPGGRRASTCAWPASCAAGATSTWSWPGAGSWRPGSTTWPRAPCARRPSPAAIAPTRAAALALRAVDALLAANRPREALQLLEELRTGPGRRSPAARPGPQAGPLGVGSRAGADYAMLRAASVPNDLAMQRQMRELGLARGRNDRGAAGRPGHRAAAPRGSAASGGAWPQIARWSGDLITSLENWVWLARRGDAAAVDEALAVARAAARLGRAWSSC